ncbi:T6SS effector BTH_I2691 family protein [Iodobacter arcticus]|uniref:T6SS effector BTH_I2691 family protein n=1 Tax=Iodobacter arcticus TaxID=590593 RepID=A0ABW2R1D1_9NEIS
MSQLCKACQASGLPIMPVRYAVVPKTVTAKLPAWAEGTRVKDIALGDEFHYALRTIRAGYVYLFYSKNARGAKQWECYTVTEDGLLLLQHTPKSASPPKDTNTCETAGHSNSRLHHLIINRPDECGPTWIAFSEHKWSDETLAQYSSDAKLRSARMQEIDPKAMAAGTKNPHSSPASQTALESIMEYSLGFSNAQLPYDQKMPIFSKRDGSYEKGQVTKVSTHYRVTSRKGVVAETLQFMQSRAKKSAGGSNTPHVMALWDAIGVAHELNGYRNNPAAYLALFTQEREFQLDAILSIETLKQSLALQRGEAIDREEDRQVVAHTTYPISNRGATQSVAKQATLYPITNSDYAREEAKKKSMARTWDKYENNIDQDAYNNFKKYQKELIESVESLADKRTQVLVRWLDAPLFIDTLEDFHGENPADGLAFESVFGGAIQGINSSESGKRKLKIWMDQIKIDKNSLFYRALAQNQKEIATELEHFLKFAKENKDKPYTEADFKEGMKSLTSWQKLFDVYKKALTVESNNAKALADAKIKPNPNPKAKAFGIALHAVPKGNPGSWIKTGGDLFFRTFLPTFNQVADLTKSNRSGHYMGEKFIQMILGARALVDPVDVKALIKEQHNADVLRRKEIDSTSKNKRETGKKDRLTSKKAAAREAAFRANQGKNLGTAWETFQKSKPADHLLAIKDMRLTLAVCLIEGVNLTRLTAFYHDDFATQALISASALSLAAGIIDISATPIKNAVGADSRSFQKMKLAGGAFSTAAGIIGAIVDVTYMHKNFQKENYFLGFLYLLKALSGGSSALLTGASTFTYAAPIILRVTSNAALAEVTTFLGVRASAIIATRIFFMSVGLWLTVGAFGIQIIIWQVTDDALETWLNLTPFGRKKDDQGAYLDSEEMKHALDNAKKELAS